MAITNFGPGTFVWTSGAPVHNPGDGGAKFAIDTVTYIQYEWVSGTTWAESPVPIKRISGTAAPSGAPGLHDSKRAINEKTPNPEIYYYFSGAWNLVAGISWPLLAPNGSAAAPSYSFANLSGAGMTYDRDLLIRTPSSAAPVSVTISAGAATGSGTGAPVLIESGLSVSGSSPTFRTKIARFLRLIFPFKTGTPVKLIPFDYSIHRPGKRQTRPTR